jgi:hypothetical protein
LAISLPNAASLRAFRTGKLPRKWSSWSEHDGKICLQLRPSGENRVGLAHDGDAASHQFNTSTAA